MIIFDDEMCLENCYGDGDGYGNGSGGNIINLGLDVNDHYYAYHRGYWDKFDMGRGTSFVFSDVLNERHY